MLRLQKSIQSVNKTVQCIYSTAQYGYELSSRTSTLANKNFSGKTYHFSLVTEKRQLYVLLVAEDLNLSPLRMDADSQANLFYTIRRLSNIS